MYRIEQSAAELLERIRLVILESPYDTWSHPLTESLYARMVGLKLKGYGEEYPYGVLPVDTNDLISDHLLVCLEDDSPSGLQPILGVRSTALLKCEIHSLPFPGLTLAQAAHAKPHARAIENLICEARVRGHGLAYTGSWTIDPSMRAQREYRSLLRDLFTTLYVSYHLEKGEPWLIAGATLRFKADKFLGAIGHDGLKNEGGLLPPIEVRHLAREKVLLTCLRQFLPEAVETAKRYRGLWSRRLVIATSDVAHFNLRKAG